MQKELDILLINPPSAPLPGINATMVQRKTHINFGLCCLAATLTENGYNVGIIDAFAFSFSENDILRIILKYRPKIVALSVYTVSLREAYSLIKLLQKIKNIEIIVGGFHITLEPDLLRHLGIKYGIVGDGDYSIVSLCDYLMKGEQKIDNLPGLIYSVNNTIRINPAYSIETLDNLPLPSYSSFLNKNGSRFHHNFRWEVVNLNVTRGCKYKCKFCSTVRFRPKVAYRSPQLVIEDIKRITSLYNIGIIFFADETFGADREHTHQIYELIQKEKLKTEWACFTRIDLLDEKIIKEMRKANCVGVFLGIEAGTDKMRKLIGKPIQGDKCKEIITICKKYDITVGVHFILGIPPERKEDIEETIRFSNYIEPDAAYYKFYVPTPGSLIYDELLKNKSISKDIWNKYMKGEVSFPVIPPNGLTEKDCEKLEIEAFKRFYFNVRRFYRLIVKFGSYVILLLWLILKEDFKKNKLELIKKKFKI